MIQICFTYEIANKITKKWGWGGQTNRRAKTDDQWIGGVTHPGEFVEYVTKVKLLNLL
jgi:hypothetical protein